MNERENLFLLAGNGPYDNKGCEAIVRGTVSILRNSFVRPRFCVASIYRSEGQLDRQLAAESDSLIEHRGLRVPTHRWSPEWFHYRLLRHLTRNGAARYTYEGIKKEMEAARAILAIGGDNFSLDYGVRPYICTDLDDYAEAIGKRVVLWGASVGPFSNDKRFERRMREHLKKVTIFARESFTAEYLRGLGLTDIYQVADPAFLLEPDLSVCRQIPAGAVGVNFSALMARSVCAGDQVAWAERAAEIVVGLSSAFDRPVVMVPHVVGMRNDDDSEFHERVLSYVDQVVQVHRLPSNLSAAQAKGAISRLGLLVGARTHATIAALSSGVPTISLGYSVKARGINWDVFGHLRYCVEGRNICRDAVCAAASEAFHADVRTHLERRIPILKAMAMNAGEFLKKCIN